MMKPLGRNAVFLAFLVALCVVEDARADFSFTSGDYYTTTFSSLNVIQYSPAGTAVGSLNLPSTLGSQT